MALVTVGLLRSLLERSLVELFEAEAADEALGVELAEHGGDAPPGDGFAAACNCREIKWALLKNRIGNSIVVRREKNPFYFDRERPMHAKAELVCTAGLSCTKTCALA